MLAPSLGRMLARGFIRRCPHCGSPGAFFVSWFRKQDRCRGCGLIWQRNLQGFMLGALAMNIVITGCALLATMIVGVVFTYPDIALVPVLVSTVAVTLIVGILGYPISYTTWLAVDLAMRPLDERDRASMSNRVFEPPNT